MHISIRKLAFSGAAVTGAVLMLGSTAYACTIFKGKLTVTPNGTGSSGSATADGNGKGMTYCSGPSSPSSATLAQGNTVGVTVGPTTTCSKQNDLSTAPANTYYALTWITGGTSADCMYYTSQQVGTISPDSSATTSAFSPPVGLFQFCVSNVANAGGTSNMQGNQVGLTAAL